MSELILGRTGIRTNKTAFGALPVQRATKEDAVKILRKAYDAGITFFDTARAYSDSEEKIGAALSDVRKDIFIATKTMAGTVENFWTDLETSLNNLKTDYIDIYQFHNPAFVPKPNDGSGLYEAMEEAKRQGKIRFISITNHKSGLAEEAVRSGLYDTLQFPFSYLSTQNDIALTKLCKEENIGFIAMKALSGGLITNSAVAHAFMEQYDNVLPIWGIQRESELDEFISHMSHPSVYTNEIQEEIERDRIELAGNFCRGCGYCMPCPSKIEISLCARMIQLIRRSPSATWLEQSRQEMMLRIEDCIECGQCRTRCPYELDTPALLKENLVDYKNIITGKVQV